jgi:hypothetical protein
MIPLTSEKKQLLFDYCIGLTSQEQTAEAEELISSNPEAAQIHSKLKAFFAPLNTLEPESCPDALAERTVWRLKSLANSSQDRLQQLLASEQTRKVTPRNRMWGRRLATAAVFMIAGSVLLTTLRYLRFNSRLQQCQLQQGSIFQGLGNYIRDHDGQQPVVAATVGAPWFKVGDQGTENHSNTRRIFLLVKGDYVKPSNFVCPCSKRGRALQMTPSQIKTYKDFPDRRCVTYSFQINCRIAGNGQLFCRKVVMADLNPLFEKLPELPEDYSKSLTLELTKDLLTLNSTNHNRHGQNILFGDGRVEYLKTRYIGTDDIYTLQNTDVYEGCEVPSCETDFFLAP